MGVIDFSIIPKGSRVTIDPAPIIFLLEEYPHFLKDYLPLFKRVEAAEIQAILSVATLAEVLAGSLRHGNEIMADRYFQTLSTSSNWQVQPMD